MTDTNADSPPTVIEYTVENFLHSPGYIPEPRKFSTGNEQSGALYLRVKLGVETGREGDRLIADEERARKITQTFRLGGYVTTAPRELTDGFYFCTQPMTLDYHRQARWERVLHRLKVMGFRSHDRRMPLVVSVDREEIGDAAAQEKFIINVLNFYGKFWGPMLTFSRRGGRSGAAYQNPGHPNEVPPELRVDTPLTAVRSGSIPAITVSPSTIDFQLGRGTFVLPTFYATLEMTNEIANMARRDTLSGIRGMSWSNVQRRVFMKYTDLDNYLRERGLM